LKFSATIVGDLASFASKAYFGKYREKFDGPIQGSSAVMYLKDGTPWRKYTQELRGHLVLRYAREFQGDSVPVSGEFNGYGTRVTDWDDAIPILHPKLATQIVLFRRRLPLGRILALMCLAGSAFSVLHSGAGRAGWTQTEAPAAGRDQDVVWAQNG
jgi:hypothetical protein